MIFNKPKANEPEQKASAIGALLDFPARGQARWTPRDYSALAREGFMRNPIVYRSIRMISEAAATVPWLAFEMNRELDDHPVLKLLNRPNPRVGGGEFLESLYGYLLTSGNGYIEAVFLDDEIRELYILRPDRMKVIPGENGWAKAYQYSLSGRSVMFEMEHHAIPQILHCTLFNPLNDYYGMSPLEASQVALDIHNAASRWNKALLDNSARPSGALIYTNDAGQMTDNQFKRLKRELEDGFQGITNAGRPMLLEGGLDWKSMALSPKDMDFIESKNIAAREIALAFGVPPMLLGIPGDTTYSNYIEANRAFWRQTILPMVSRLAKALTNWLSPLYGPDFKITYDMDAIDALSAERAQLWERVGAADFLTQNEKRVAVGYGILEQDEFERDVSDRAEQDETPASSVSTPVSMPTTSIPTMDAHESNITRELPEAE